MEGWGTRGKRAQETKLLLARVAGTCMEKGCGKDPHTCLELGSSLFHQLLTVSASSVPGTGWSTERLVTQKHVPASISSDSQRTSVLGPLLPSPGPLPTQRKMPEGGWQAAKHAG